MMVMCFLRVKVLAFLWWLGVVGESQLEPVLAELVYPEMEALSDGETGEETVESLPLLVLLLLS